jgi:hypothetical protein
MQRQQTDAEGEKESNRVGTETGMNFKLMAEVDT